MNTQHNYDGRTMMVGGELYLWGRAKDCTDVLRLDEDGERYLFTLPFLAESDTDILPALEGWLDAMEDEQNFLKEKWKSTALRTFGYNAARNMKALQSNL